MAKIVAIANQKGGVGKTTTAVNFSACLAAAEKKTLLLDLDPQGNASSGVGLAQETFSEANIYQAIIGDKTITECIYNTELPYFDIAPSNNNLVGAEMELQSMLARESKLKNALQPVAETYDYIIIDCPPALGLLTLNALNAAHSVIIPLQTEFFAMEGMAQLLNTISLVKTSINPKLDIEGILLTMYSNNNLSKQVTSEIQEHFPDKVFETIIPRNVKLSEAPSHGKPILLYDIESRGCEAYISFTKEMLMRERERKQKEINQMTLF